GEGPGLDPSPMHWGGSPREHRIAEQAFGAGASGSTTGVYTRENEETSLAWMTVARAIAVTIDELILRTIRENDWAAILDLANLSLSELPSAQRQDEWLENRRAFLASGGFHVQFVATETG